MLLVLDTATPLVTVALHDGTDVVAEHRSDIPLKHGEHLAPAIEQVLVSAGATVGDVTAVGVGVGPGPFTGLRVGLVTARTLGFALDVPTYGVCTLDVMALEAAATLSVNRPFLVASDARRKEVYLASYDVSGARIAGPAVAKPADVTTDVPVVGEGPVLYPEAFPQAAAPRLPSAGWLARGIVGERVEIVPPEPLYLRRPDAVASAPKSPAPS